jgi:hypothetical protein
VEWEEWRAHLVHREEGVEDLVEVEYARVVRTRIGNTTEDLNGLWMGKKRSRKRK